MVHCNAIIKHRSTISHFIGPVIKDAVVQLGGSEPEAMAMAVKIIKENGWEEVNINCGKCTIQTRYKSREHELSKIICSRCY